MIYAIGDLHLDYTKAKDMKVFGGNWDDYENKIFTGLKDLKDDDILLIPGDICWAMRLEDAKIDLKRIDDMKGKKFLIKGNHDYWWQSFTKIKDLGFESLNFIQNTSYIVDGVKISGTRGWISRDHNDFKQADEKVYKRELERLKLSLEDKKEVDHDLSIVMLHYPPFDKNGLIEEYKDILLKFGVDIVVYGHIHGENLRNVFEGEIEGIRFYCVSGDHLDFVPRNIAK